MHDDFSAKDLLLVIEDVSLGFAEMLPKWYNTEKIPFSTMWPDDYLWFPMMLRDQKFYGYFVFDGMDTILNYTLGVVGQLDSVDIPQKPRSNINDL